MRVDSGRDYQARIMGDTASTATGNYAPANFIGVTSDNTAPAASDTALANEIASGSLIRRQASYAHTTGTAAYTLTTTFTSDQNVTINKIGVFNASTIGSGTMVFETLLNSAAVLVSGDQLQITETVTL